MKSFKLIFFFVAAIIVALTSCSQEELFNQQELKGNIPIQVSGSSSSQSQAGFVFTTTNAADGNEVVAYTRSGNGILKEAVRYTTGGSGTSRGLGSQNAVLWDGNKKLLFVVDAGSNDISVLSEQGKEIALVDRIASEGEMPVSLSCFGDYLYVVNAGGSGNIAGFEVNQSGKLSYVPGSKQYLSNDGQGAAPGPAQIEFSPDGSWLVVTEKPTNQILLYPVVNGVAQSPIINPSAGETPFGFFFTRKGVLAVSEAFGGAANASVLSTYRIHPDGSLEVISDQVPTHQTAACWAIITKNQKYVYTTNTASGSISSFDLNADGSVQLQESVAGFNGPGTGPIDMALSINSKFLYTLNGQSGSISAYKVQANGTLEALETVNGLPKNSAGIAAQ